MVSTDFYDAVVDSDELNGYKIGRKVIWTILIGDEMDLENKPLIRLNYCKPMKMSIVNEVTGQNLNEFNGQEGILDETILEWTLPRYTSTISTCSEITESGVTRLICTKDNLKLEYNVAMTS